MRKFGILAIVLVSVFRGYSTNNEKLTVFMSPEWDTINVQLKSHYSNSITYFPNDQLVVPSEVFIKRMASLEYEIPMDYNEHVAHYIDVFATSWQHKLKEVITLSYVYFPIYEELLDREGVPMEIKYLSVIESALNPVAVSRAGAVGPWQFMPATGRLYKLDINSQVDERSHIEHSTLAASKYLKSMYVTYGDWLVALASYNCGPGNINKAIRRSGGKRTFWEIYPYLPQQTRNYIPKYIAMAYLMNFHQAHDIKPAFPQFPLEYSRVRVTKEHNFEAIRDVLALSDDEFFFLNKQFKHDGLPYGLEEEYLWLPSSKATEFVLKEEDILALSVSEEYQKKTITVVVKRGESLPVIARRNQCTVTELKSWNNLRSNVIHPGQKLVVHL
jgi:membrane-bound lytic murein transglycosylase D